MTTDHTIIQLDNNTDLLLLDDEDDLRNVATMDQAHQFLNFSRKIAESSSMKRPVDIQLGIACGKDLIFSRSLLNKSPLNNNPKNPLQLVNDATSALDKTSPYQESDSNSNNSKDFLQIDKKGEKESSPLREQQSLPLPLPSPQIRDKSTQDINNKNSNNSNNNSTSESYRTNTIHQIDKAFVEIRMNQIKRGNSSGLLDRLVADVLRHIESCPDQSAYSDDLDRLKPKLEAYKVTRQKA